MVPSEITEDLSFCMRSVFLRLLISAANINVLFRQLSHSVVRTDDHIYFCNESKTISDGDKATNADNYAVSSNVEDVRVNGLILYTLLVLRRTDSQGLQLLNIMYVMFIPSGYIIVCFWSLSTSN
jgi:hypothetical protein